jgi:hypothetical protein
MIILDIHHQLRGKAIRSRILIESCLKTLERRCSVAVKGPAHCRVRVSREHSGGHAPTHQPLRVVAWVELIIPGWGRPFVATCTADRLRPAVAGAVGAIEKMLRRESEKHESERRHWTRAHRWDAVREEETA